jgi:TetR/AcrR family transcriptional repressor of mexJK operon
VGQRRGDTHCTVEFVVLFDYFTNRVERTILDGKFTKDRVDIILRAAQRRFASFSYSKVTMDEVAEDIGMAKASLYYYFPTKEAIFRSVVQHEQAEFLRQANDTLRQKHSTDVKLLEYVRLRLKLAERLHNLSHIHQQGWHDIKPIFKDLFAAFVQQEVRCVTQILQEGKKNGEFHVEHPQKTALMIVHALQGLHMRFFRGYDQHETTESDCAMFEQEILHFVNIVLHGILKIK